MAVEFGILEPKVTSTVGERKMSGHESDQKVWEESFSEKVRTEQREDDSAAWNAVTGLLLTIISIGLSLAVFTVWVCA